MENKPSGFLNSHLRYPKNRSDTAITVRTTHPQSSGSIVMGKVRRRDKMMSRLTLFLFISQATMFELLAKLILSSEELASGLDRDISDRRTTIGNG